MILRDRTKKMKRENILRYTHRPYVDFDSYVETYKNFVNKKYTAILSKLGVCSEALVYAMHKNLSKENLTIIGNGFFHDEGAEKGMINECMLSIPLNGIKILDKIVYSNISIDGTPSEYRYECDYIDELKWNNPTYLNTYMDFCNVKNIESPMLNLEYGDIRFLFNPILSIKFNTNVNEFYTLCSQFVFNLYGLLRYHQYKAYGKKVVLDFNKNQYASGLCTLLAHPHFEYKISLPCHYGLLGNDIEFSNDVFKNIKSLFNLTIDKKDKVLSIFKIYEEFWELILLNDYELAIVKVLSFLEYYFKCKRLLQVPKVVSNLVDLPSYDKEIVEKNLHNLIKIKNRFIHEANTTKLKHINCSTYYFYKAIYKYKKEIYFLLDLFNEMITKILKDIEKYDI